MKPIKLVLSGSGTRYPVFIGAIRRLEKANYKISEVCGVSGGSIIAAGLAKGMNSVELEKLAKSTLPGPLLDARWFTDWISNDPYKGIWKGNKFLKKFYEVLPKSFDECKIPLHIVTFNISRGQHRIWSAATKAEFNDVPRLVRASMSLPVFDSCMINGEWHEDGGFGANFPLDVFGHGQDVIGMRFRGTDPRKIRKFSRKTERLVAMIDDFIESAAREHIEDAMFARVMLLDTKAGGLDLGMNASAVDSMIKEGEASADKWLSENL